MAGYSGTPLAKKLGIKEGHRVGVVDDPGHFRELLGDLPAGVRYQARPPAGEPLDVVIFFAPDRAALERGLPAAKARLDVDGGLWLAWPKQSSALATELRESDVRSLGLAARLVDNKICAVDDDWSGLRFVYRKEDRAALRQG